MKEDKTAKEIIIVDIAECCKECEFYYGFKCIERLRLNPAFAEKDKKSGWCRLTTGYVEKDEKPGWCPRMPLPKKKELSYEDWDYDTRASAWNSCIDSITSMQKQGGAAGLNGSSK